MKVGDLVEWYSGSARDIGIVVRYRETGAPWYIVWSSNDGNGWFDGSHPSIQVVR